MTTVWFDHCLVLVYSSMNFMSYSSWKTKYYLLL